MRPSKVGKQRVIYMLAGWQKKSALIVLNGKMYSSALHVFKRLLNRKSARVFL